MRTRRRIAALLVSAAALGVGFVAFPGSAAAAPPVVPTCAFPATAGSDSCGTIRTDGLRPSPAIGAAYENIRLGVRVRSQFTPTTSETNSVTLRFDDDIALNLAGIPACPASEVWARTSPTAYEQCGPNADGTPASEGNAFLSPAGNVSGIGSTIPTAGGADACTMIFKGATNNALTIYARAPVANAATGCNSPATNTGGTTTVVFTGDLTHQPAAVAVRLDAHGARHLGRESRPGRLLRDRLAWSRLPGAVPRWGIPPQDAGGLGLHRCRRSDRHARLDERVPVAEPVS